jgi:hypothetical protein
MKKFIRFLLLIPAFSHAAPTSRVGSIIFNKGTVEKIYLASGLGSVLIFPCPIDEAFLGRSSEVTVLTSPKTKKNLLLSVKSSFSEATNLIVRCEEQLAPFVFDLIPSRAKHQDVILIRSSIGSPTLAQENLELIESSDQKAQARSQDLNAKAKSQPVVILKPQLVGEGESR